MEQNEKRITGAGPGFLDRGGVSFTKGVRFFNVTLLFIKLP